jgi:mono/diheme cytochrome c family protein
VFKVVAVVLLVAAFSPSGQAMDSVTPAAVTAGRALALTACTGCHIVSSDQPFAPVFTGPPPPPDFRSIANMPGTTIVSLRHFLSTLHPVPLPQHMADPNLSAEEREKVIAYILSLQAPH